MFNKEALWKTILLMVGAFIVGAVVFKLSSTPSAIEHAVAGETQAVISWTCSMHPQVNLPRPGKCPICFMNLIPASSESTAKDNNRAAELRLSPEAQILAEVETALVERKAVSKTIRMFGVIDYDESKIAHITARIAGRVDKLYVDFTGMAVRKGDHMVEYYSPDLYVAQKELLQSSQGLSHTQAHGTKNHSGMSDLIPSGADPERANLMRSTIRRLELWGLTEANIRKILATGEVVENVTLYAPISGIVIHKNVVEGKYFNIGDRLFTIADMSSLWILLEAYEPDIQWLHYGQKVEFTTASSPGEKFTGTISFISPVLDPETRTVKLRVDAPNPDGKLKPSMFVDATVYAEMTHNGRIAPPDLTGKWMCPMHPVIVKDVPAKCDICHMPLETTESLGYVKPRTTDLPLVIPTTAPLITGRTAVVYLSDNPGYYYGREIVLGPRVDNYYVVESGLKEGERIVINGNFKIDSALQIQARPSMMNPARATSAPKDKTVSTRNSAPVPKPEQSKDMKRNLDLIYSGYFSIQTALANDDIAATVAAAKQLNAQLKHMHAGGMSDTGTIDSSVAMIAAANELNKARESFEKLSIVLFALIKKYGTAGNTIYQFYCPMVFDNKGAYWFQDHAQLTNPYFGAVMLRCGEKLEEITK
ncbi:MAG: efflux RND transporter periplasmic adaptor subunit [Victivallales bacterium]|nr:efflux RND transporter periplasmic adaptor subunit [Victivallales bacterium]